MDGNDFVYEVTVPGNTTATVTLPAAKADQVNLNGQASKAEMKQAGSAVTLNIGSGSYQFRYPAEGLKK